MAHLFNNLTIAKHGPFIQIRLTFFDPKRDFQYVIIIKISNCMKMSLENVDVVSSQLFFFMKAILEWQ